MTKYNYSQIMKAAWIIKKSSNTTMSFALKTSWAQAKSAFAGKIVAINGTERQVNTIYRESRGCYANSYFKDEVLEAREDGKGNITLQYAKGGEYTKSAKTNRTNYVTFFLCAGAFNGELFGIDLSQAKSFSGKTYSVRASLKDAGFRWNAANQSWVRA